MKPVATLQLMLVVALVLGILTTAVAVSYQSHQHRLLVAQLQYLQMLEAELEADWSRLLIEQGTYSRHSRIESQARQLLNMHLPRVDETIVVIPP